MHLMKELLLVSTFLLLISVVVMKHALNNIENETYNETIQSTTSSPETPKEKHIEDHITKCFFIVASIVIILNTIAVIFAFIHWLRNCNRDNNNNPVPRTPPASSPSLPNNQEEVFEMVMLDPRIEPQREIEQQRQNGHVENPEQQKQNVENPENNN